MDVAAAVDACEASRHQVGWPRGLGGRQTLLRREEESQAREDARHAARRLKGRRPRERRRGRDSDQSAAAGRGHSLDNMAAESRAGAADTRRKGVSGRTAEGTAAGWRIWGGRRAGTSQILRGYQGRGRVPRRQITLQSTAVIGVVLCDTDRSGACGVLWYVG